MKSLELIQTKKGKPMQIHPQDLLEDVKLPEQGLDLKRYIEQLECTLINQALNENRGCVARAGYALSMNRTTLLYKIQKYGLRHKIVAELLTA